MNLKLTSLWTNFLTSNMDLVEPERLRKIRLLNLFELVFIVASPLLGLFYFFVGAPFLFFITIIFGLLTIGVVLFLRMTKNLDLSSNIAVFVLWAFLIVVRWLSGGISSESLILLSWVWNGVLILFAIFMTGYKWGTIWACLVFVEGGLALILYQNNYAFTNLIPPEIAPIYSFGFYLTGLLAALLFAFLFEKGREDARIREQEKSRMLTDSTRYIERILERLPVATFVLDNSHRVVQWNRACHELTGVSSQEIIGKRVWEGFSLDEDGSMADKLLDNPDVLHEKYSDSIVSMSDSGSFSVDTMLPNLRGGLHAVVRAAPILDQDGRVQGAIQTVQEIGNDQEESTTEGPGFLDGSIEEVAYPVFKIDSKGKISGWNKSCEEKLGYTASQMLGKNALSFVSKAHRRNFRDAIVRVLKGESFDNREWKYYTGKGEPIYVLARGFPEQGPSGDIQECIIINTDITDITLRMKKLGRSALEIKEKFKKLLEEHNLLKKNIASFIRKKNE